MQPQKKRRVVAIAVASVATLALIGGAVAFVRAGLYNVAADDPHYPLTHAVLDHLREASIDARASKLAVPKDLMSQVRITQGAGNYNAMCMGCHLAPGMTETEMSKGLYPAPPDLTGETVDAAEAFWVIKHGIKASGMPAWGKSMDDEYIWNMVAFVRQLPSLTEEQYAATVARSGGHSHGGGETTPHDHAEGTPADHHAAPTGHDHTDPPGAPPHEHGKAAAASTVHTHADGQQHVHAADAPKPQAETAAAPSKPARSTPEPESEPKADDHDAHEHQH